TVAPDATPSSAAAVNQRSAPMRDRGVGRAVEDGPFVVMRGERSSVHPTSKRARVTTGTPFLSSVVLRLSSENHRPIALRYTQPTLDPASTLYQSFWRARIFTFVPFTRRPTFSLPFGSLRRGAASALTTAVPVASVSSVVEPAAAPPSSLALPSSASSGCLPGGWKVSAYDSVYFRNL